ncbi:MAG TPA: SusC/RagA family TonB-linked outer membrane protein [Agriterribacter sp.]|nr:SusC/RagA family TonB-linked outer membrane protein [Chitinophagaceae bacterium]HRP30770.1 SusC/RagA family TonB-linked outer membrane protein [Agriterribacter sp.]
MTQRLLWLMVWLLPLYLPLSAQGQGGVTGTVHSESGDAVVGASVTAQSTSGNTKSTVVSNENGAFSFSGLASGRYTFTVSSVGYNVETVSGTVGSTVLQLQIVLKVAAQSLEDIVVVGYGTQRKRDVTGAVKSVKAEDFNRGIVNNPQQLLQGKVAGVNVTSSSGEPGAPINIVIRGAASVRNSSAPLFVIDGVPLDNAGTGTGDALNFLNPQDIASMDILKDASATAIYGSRGANGVIIITTKKGKAGTSVLNFTTSAGISNVARKLPVFSTSEFKKQVVAVGGDLEDFGASTNWQDEIFRTGNTFENNLTLSGGSNKLVYYTSLNAQNQTGILKGSTLKRYTGRFNATQKFWDDRLSVDANLTASNTKNRRPSIGGLLGSSIANNPTLPARDAEGNPAKFENASNPLLDLELFKDIASVNRVLGNISPTLKIIKGLTYKLNFGIDNTTTTRDIVNYANAVPQRDGSFETQSILLRNRLIENYLTYTTDIGKHSISALAGHSYQNILYQYRSSSINKLPLNDLDPIYNPGIGQELTMANNRPTGNANISELQSYFGRINYAFENKYLVTASLRMDGSTKFGENNRYGYFPSFALGWNITEEAFMDNSLFSTLKLRGGWGMTGNQEIDPKSTQPLFKTEVTSGTSYPLYPSGAYPPGTFFVRLANPDLQWEATNQINIGVDFGLFNGDLSGTIDWFDKTTNNILLSIPPQDPVQPAGAYYANIPGMKIKNTGVEIDLAYRKRINSNLSFGIGGNASFMKNNVTGSPYQVIFSGSATGSGLTSATLNGYINGNPIGSFYLLNFIGIDEDGLSKYADTDKDGIITPKDRVIAGAAVPKTLYSFFGNLAYRGFEFIVNFNGVSGNKIYDNTATANFYKAKIAKNNNTTTEAIQYPDESINNPASVSTRYLKDGGYLRLNNLSLAYNFSTSRLGIQNWITNLRLSVTAQNLFVITKYDGFDPEINSDRSIAGAVSYGIDYLNYPKARSVIFGLNLSF